MKYYLIAGEASGDLHGGNLMKAISKKDAAANFRFWGGSNMADAGGTQVEHYRNTAFMGFWEVVKHLRTILNFIKFCKTDILDYQPDVLILIDYPGFNMRIAKWAKKQGIRVVYYISPQIWAWKESRVHAIKRDVDQMLVILPFEKDFYQKHNFEVDFVGHPLLDEIQKKYAPKKTKVLEEPELDIVALLPGSRKQEIETILPEFLKVVNHFPDYRFVVAGVHSVDKKVYEQFTANERVKVTYNQTYELLSVAKAALVASGTATLETALFNVPMVVGYKGSWLSYQIGKRLVNVKYIALVNLVMDKKVVAELIQSDLNETLLVNELKQLLDTEKRKLMKADFAFLKERLGNFGASDRAAAAILDSNDKI